jgi:hypothetical protein
MSKLVLPERVRSAKTEEKQERLIDGLKELLKQAQSGGLKKFVTRCRSAYFTRPRAGCMSWSGFRRF